MYSLKYGKPRYFKSASGVDYVSATASATEEFWKVWRVAKDDLKIRGYSVFKSSEGNWVVKWTGNLASQKENVLTLEALKAQIDAKAAPAKPRVVVSNSDERPPWEGPSMFDSK